MPRPRPTLLCLSRIMHYRAFSSLFIAPTKLNQSLQCRSESWDRSASPLPCLPLFSLPWPHLSALITAMPALYFAPHNQAKPKPLLNCNTHHDAFAMPCITTTFLNSPMPLRLNALLCRSYTCRCQCSAAALVCYSMPKPSIPLLCPSSAYLRLAHALRFFSLPSQLSSTLRLCPSMPKPFIAILFPCTADLCPAKPLQFNTLPPPLKSTPLRNVTLLCLLAAVHGLRMSCPLKATALHRHRINQALPTQKHPCHCSATGPDRYSVRSRANP